MENKALQMVAQSNKTLKYDNLSLSTKKVLTSIDLKTGVFTVPQPGKLQIIHRMKVMITPV